MFAYPTAGNGRRASALIWALPLTLLLGLAPVLSARAAPAPQPSAAALAAAKELVIVKGADKLWHPLIIGVVERSKRVLLQTNPMVGKDLNEVAAKLQSEFAPRSAELVNESAKLYAARFTEQELKDAVTFYKTPLGRKLLAEEPVLLEQSMKEAQTWADKLSEEVIRRFRAEMKKRGHEI
jgi:uncharacterized protein